MYDVVRVVITLITAASASAQPRPADQCGELIFVLQVRGGTDHSQRYTWSQLAFFSSFPGLLAHYVGVSRSRHAVVVAVVVVDFVVVVVGFGVVVCCLLFGVCCLLCVGCWLLFAVCCALFVVCCVLLSVVC